MSLSRVSCLLPLLSACCMCPCAHEAGPADPGPSECASGIVVEAEPLPSCEEIILVPPPEDDPDREPPQGVKYAKGLPKGIFGKIAVRVAPSNPDRVYALIEAEEGGLFRSDDGGKAWERINAKHSLRQRHWYFTHLAIDPKNGRVETLFEGTSEQPFYTGQMGKQQHLPNGNVLITEATAGRALEIDPAGQIVWAFVSRFDDDHVTVLEQATRYPESHADFIGKACPSDPQAAIGGHRVVSDGDAADEG